MPRRCSVFGCRSNYDTETEKTSTFSLPSDENRRRLWLRQIPTDFSKLKNPIVCIKHFDESCIIKVDKVMVRGELKEFDRIIPKLTENAVPTIFPNTPSYCSKSTPKIRRLADVEEDHLETAIRDSIQSSKIYLEEDSLNSLNDISLFLETRKIYCSKWTVIKDEEKMHICLLGVDNGVPCITSFISVHADLTFVVNTNVNQSCVNNASFNNIKRLNSINVLDSIMSQVESGETLTTIRDKLDSAV